MSIKAVSLFSGGLDSSLIVKIIQEQGIEVHALHINIGFESNQNKEEFLKKAAQELGVELTIIDIRDEYIKTLLFNPVYGYGKNMNPCIDCHAKMITVAKAFMKEIGAHFMISGEVVGQRPMSQRIEALKKVNKLSNEEGLLLRPLSAKLLEPTIAESQGWVDREKLYEINGRDRKTQMALAEKFGLKNYESPSGGCLLTDQNFSIKLRDFVKDMELAVEDLNLLKSGRHLRINEKKVVISRNQDEAPFFKAYNSDKFLTISTVNFPGPHGLIDQSADKETKKLAADIFLTYTKQEKAEVKIGEEIFDATSLKNKDLVKRYMIL